MSTAQIIAHATIQVVVNFSPAIVASVAYMTWPRKRGAR